MMFPRGRLAAVLGTVVVLLWAVPIGATTFSRATVSDLVKKSRNVCCGRCVAVEARVDARSGFVFTYATMRIVEDLKGRAAAAEIVVRVPGGTANRRTTVVPGMPRFKPGESCVLLLGKKSKAGYPVFMEGGRGLLPLMKDRRGVWRLRDAPSGFPELKSEAGVTLDAFGKAVRALVRKEEAKARARAEAGK